MSQGQRVRIAVGKIGEVVNKQGGVLYVQHAGGTSTFRARELEVV